MPTNTTFADFNLNPRLVSTLATMGIQEPTPIQNASLPVFLSHENIIALASTGSGKTIAFLAPLMHHLLALTKKNRIPRALALVPTRELALQVYKNFEKLRAGTNLTAALVIGGDGFVLQEQQLKKGVDLIIATPGRLLDFIGRGKLLLSHIHYLVLDEADRMTDMGFYPDIRQIISYLPYGVHYSLFSATMPTPVQELINSFVMHPKTIKVNNPKQSAASIEQYLAKVAIPEKAWRRNMDYMGFVRRELLRFILRRESPESAIIFCNRKRDVDNLQRSLTRHNYNCIALHGDMTQDLRFESLTAFETGASSILIASDVAARGLDIPNVSHVFNFDIPLSQDDYIHRIGRTGRAGKKGKAFTLTLSDTEYERLSHHVKDTIKPLDLAGFELPAPQLAKKERPKKEKAAAADPSQLPLRSRRHRAAHHSDDTPAVVGFGDDIPAFILQSIS